MKIVKDLLTDNAILKKGLQIQNKRYQVRRFALLLIQDNLLRMQEFDLLVQENQK